MLKGVRLWVVCLVVGLAMQFPTGNGYLPVARVLWVVLTGDVGHFSRSYLAAWALGMLAVYTAAAYLLVCSIRWLLKRL